MSPLGNEDARAQVGTNGGLSQQWREVRIDQYFKCPTAKDCADELDAAKLRIEEAVKAASYDDGHPGYAVEREAVLKIIRETL